jgi:hypothetical protein
LSIDAASLRPVRHQIEAGKGQPVKAGSIGPGVYAARPYSPFWPNAFALLSSAEASLLAPRELERIKAVQATICSLGEEESEKHESSADRSLAYPGVGTPSPMRNLL